MDPIAQTSSPIPLMLRALRNDSLSARLRLYDARTGKPIVLTGWSATASIYASINSASASHSLTVTVDQAGAGQATTGIVTISVDGGVTSTWIEDGYWALTMIDDPTRKTIIAGPWELRGPAPSSVVGPCGLCASPGVGAAELEALGVNCDVVRHGYWILKLPAPQPECPCSC